MMMNHVTEGMIWAHRGRNRIAPENTLASFQAALDAGDAGIEMDVTLSSDGIPVIIHDDSIDRTTNGTGFVADLSFEYLSHLDAGSWFDICFKDETLPRLSDVLMKISGAALVNIEIKSSAWRNNLQEGIELTVLDIINRLDLMQSVLISSFEWRILKRIRSLDNMVNLGVLGRKGQNPGDAVLFAGDIDAFSIHPDIRDLVGGMPGAYKKFFGKIYPYTISDEIIGLEVLQRGADGFFADLPFQENMGNTGN